MKATAETREHKADPIATFRSTVQAALPPDGWRSARRKGSKLEPDLRTLNALA